MDHRTSEVASASSGHPAAEDASRLMASFTDEHGITWYPVKHALGAIVCSLTKESQKLWQELADRQSAQLIERCRAKSRKKP
jgi:hypothetical protein